MHHTSCKVLIKGSIQSMFRLCTIQRKILLIIDGGMEVGGERAGRGGGRAPGRGGKEGNRARPLGPEAEAGKRQRKRIGKGGRQIWGVRDHTWQGAPLCRCLVLPHLYIFFIHIIYEITIFLL